MQDSACGSCIRQLKCPGYSFALANARADSEDRFSTLLTDKNTVILQQGERFKGVYLVRSGLFKSTQESCNGHSQVVGFHLPGEVLGVDGIGSRTYHSTVESLRPGSACKIPESTVFGFIDTASERWHRSDSTFKLLSLLSEARATQRKHVRCQTRQGPMGRFGNFLLDISERSRTNENNGNGSVVRRLGIADVFNYLQISPAIFAELLRVFAGLEIIQEHDTEFDILPGSQVLLYEIVTSQVYQGTIFD